MRDNEKPRWIIWSNPVRPSHFWTRWLDEDGVLHYGGKRQQGRDPRFAAFMAKVLDPIL